MIATYNINYGMTDAKSLEAIVALIKKADADLVAVQETTNASVIVLRAQLAKQYPEMVFQGADAAGGFGLFAKSKLDKRYLPPVKDGGWFGTLAAKTHLGGKDVWVVNVHLRATVPPKGASVKQIMDLFSQTEDVRGREMRSILAEVAKLNTDKLPVIYLGDFNSPTKASAALTVLSGSGYADSFASVTKQPDTQPTWHWKMESADITFRLDYIFHGRSLRTLESNVLTGGPSDHSPVVSKLQWEEFVKTPPLSAARTPASVPVPKTLAEALASPESMAAGLRSGMAKKDMIEKKVSWKLLFQELVQEGDQWVMKANSESGFSITCHVPADSKALLETLKADAPVRVEGAILNLEYEKPQDTTDIFLAKIETLGVLVDATAVKKEK